MNTESRDEDGLINLSLQMRQEAKRIREALRSERDKVRWEVEAAEAAHNKAKKKLEALDERVRILSNLESACGYLPQDELDGVDLNLDPSKVRIPF